MTKSRVYYARKGEWLFWGTLDAEEGVLLPTYCEYAVTAYKLPNDLIVGTPAYRVGQLGFEPSTRRWYTLAGAWWDGIRVRYNWRSRGGDITYTLDSIIAVCEP